MAPRVAIIIYSMYGHVATLAEAEKVGIEKAGGTATIYQVPETLSTEILAKMHAPPKKDYPIATNETLTSHDAFLFGIPTRYGTYPAQWKTFWDATGHLVKETKGETCAVNSSAISGQSGSSQTVAQIERTDRQTAKRQTSNVKRPSALP
jgi:multimeric flavodoxin WrbA